MKAFLAAVVALTLVLAGAGFAVAYSGWYDVSADHPHQPVTKRVLDWIVWRSIAVRADGIAAPPDLRDEKRIAAGAAVYRDMCVPCHRAPGESETPLSRGLYPRPPDFTRSHIEPATAFWVAKHGLKMTGMPAWGETYGDDELWNVVAFVMRLPSIDATRYREMTAPAAGEGTARPATTSDPASAAPAGRSG